MFKTQALCNGNIQYVVLETVIFFSLGAIHYWPILLFHYGDVLYYSYFLQHSAYNYNYTVHCYKQIMFFDAQYFSFYTVVATFHVQLQCIYSAWWSQAASHFSVPVEKFWWLFPGCKSKKEHIWCCCFVVLLTSIQSGWVTFPVMFL